MHSAGDRSVALMELPPISGSPNSGNSLPLQVGVEVVSFLSFSVFLALSHLGSVPNFGFRRLAGTAALRGPRRFFSCAAEFVAIHLTACWHRTLWRTQHQNH
jgi:hypothetical protein